MIRGVLLALLLAGVPAAAQQVVPPRQPDFGRRADQWRLALQPTGLLVDGGGEWQLRGWIDLVHAGDADEGFALAAGLHGLRADRRSWAGAEGRARRTWNAGPLRPWLSTALLGGSGDGAVWAFVADAGTHVGDLVVHVRTVRLSMPDSADRPFVPEYAARHGYTDAELGVRRRLGRVELAALGGLRFGGALSHGRWGSVSVAVPLHPRIDIVGAGGTRPERADIGEVAGAFLSLGLRLQPRPHVLTPVPDPPRMPEPGLTAARGNGRSWTLIAHADARHSVEISGDLTDWTPRAMTRTRDRWSIAIAADPGVYHVVVRVDGGPWRPPPGLPAVPDGFGGRTGLLILR